MSDPGDRWRIKEFAARVGMQEVTLRAWERRYGLLRPERTAGGFRLYSTADERRIRSMQAHMARGLAAAQAATLALAESESATPVVAPASAIGLVAALLAATEAYDATRFDALLDATFTREQPEAIGDVILPVLVEIGQRWASAELSVGHEHFASHLIERRLLALAAGWESGAGPTALLACPSGERHTLGLVCLGLLLAGHGWRIAYLGADTPIEHIAEFGESVRPDAVVLTALDERYLTRNAAGITALGRRMHTIVSGSGASAGLARRLGVRHAPGDPISTAQELVAAPPRQG